MFEVVFLILAVALMAGAWWWLKRRRRELLGQLDEPAGDTEPPAPQALTRDALMNRPRTFDPNAWDDGPGRSAKPAPAPASPAAPRPAPAAPSDDEDEAPAYFDREFLARRQRERQGEPPAERTDGE